MTAYLYDRYGHLKEVFNNCSTITPTYIEYVKFGQIMWREVGDGEYFTKTIMR